MIWSQGWFPVEWREVKGGGDEFGGIPCRMSQGADPSASSNWNLEWVEIPASFVLVCRRLCSDFFNMRPLINILLLFHPELLLQAPPPLHLGA